MAFEKVVIIECINTGVGNFSLGKSKAKMEKKAKREKKLKNTFAKKMTKKMRHFS